jgi:hypothetical protein
MVRRAFSDGTKIVFFGVSSDVKPLIWNGVNVPPSSEFHEADSGKKYLFDGKAWFEDTAEEGSIVYEIPIEAQTLEVLQDILLELRKITVISHFGFIGTLCDLQSFDSLTTKSINDLYPL